MADALSDIMMDDDPFGEVQLVQTIDPIKPKRGGRTATYEPVKLDTLDEAKKFYAQIINDYASGVCSENQSRCLGYLMSGYLSYFKLEIDSELLKRVEALEERTK
jgi:hypothetical protein